MWSWIGLYNTGMVYIIFIIHQIRRHNVPVQFGRLQRLHVCFSLK